MKTATQAAEPAQRAVKDSPRTIEVDAEAYLQALKRETAFVDGTADRLNMKAAELKRLRKAAEDAIIEGEAAIARTETFLRDRAK